ncbi:MAG: hypothetical protein CVU00_00310 [Bacteroidetes bacterium HGW-Bacteroidetes-17]|jgi:hypothetical protein|nr:MAG: hypothetical protein CVU00_00310 [Bacteroidetes bacterium HGW-Bacteroidetes-17]
MNRQKRKLFLIKTAYWLGIIADAFWAIGLLFPRIFSILTGKSDFNPDLQFRLVMSIGGIVIAGWTILLLWAVKKPIERRFVILLTAILVVGLSIVALIGYLDGNTRNIWILIKNSVLFIFMVTSYLLANNIDKAINRNPITEK